MLCLYITVTATDQVENITNVITDCHQPERQLTYWFILPTVLKQPNTLRNNSYPWNNFFLVLILFLAVSPGVRDRSSLIGDWTQARELKVHCPNHWTIREFPDVSHFLRILLYIILKRFLLAYSWFTTLC